MDRYDQILTAVLFAAVMFSGLAWIAATHQSGSAAEWAGATGTTTAVVVALWTARTAAKVQRRRDLARGKAALLRMMMPATLIYGWAKRSRDRIDQIPDPILPDSEKVQMFSTTSRLPEDALANAWAMDPAVALAAAQLDAVLVSHNQMVEREIPTWRKIPITTIIALQVRVASSLDVIMQLAEELQNAAQIENDRIVEASRKQKGRSS